MLFRVGEEITCYFITSIFLLDRDRPRELNITLLFLYFLLFFAWWSIKQLNFKSLCYVDKILVSIGFIDLQ